jgi:hypothetical protein
MQLPELHSAITLSRGYRQSIWFREWPLIPKVFPNWPEEWNPWPERLIGDLERYPDDLLKRLEWEREFSPSADDFLLLHRVVGREALSRVLLRHVPQMPGWVAHERRQRRSHHATENVEDAVQELLVRLLEDPFQYLSRLLQDPIRLIQKDGDNAKRRVDRMYLRTKNIPLDRAPEPACVDSPELNAQANELLVRFKEISDPKMYIIVEMKLNGATIEDIVELTKLSRATVYRYLHDLHKFIQP